MATVNRTVNAAWGSNVQAQASLTVTEQSVDRANNTSVVKWAVTIVQHSNGSYFNGHQRTQAGIVQVTVDGTKVLDSYYPLNTTSALGNYTVLSENGTRTITHNDDGTKTISFNLNLNQGNDNYSNSGYYWKGDGDSGVNGSLTLTPTPPFVGNYKLGANWKEASKVYIKVDGTWKEIKKTYIKQNGVWKS